MALFEALWSLQSKGAISMRCVGGGGAKDSISYKCNHIKTPENKGKGKKERQKEKESDVNCKELGALPDRHAYYAFRVLGHTRISRPEVVYSVASTMVQWSELLWLENPRRGRSAEEEKTKSKKKKQQKKLNGK